MCVHYGLPKFNDPTKYQLVSAVNRWTLYAFYPKEIQFIMTKPHNLLLYRESQLFAPVMLWNCFP